MRVGRKNPEVSGVLVRRKAQEIHKSEIPVECISRFADNFLLDIPRETHAPTETENPHSSQDGEASMNTSLESVVLSPDTQQELETHIVKLRVRHR